MSEEGSSAPKLKPKPRGNWAALLAAALFIAVALWMGSGSDLAGQKGNWQGRKYDYYNLLAHGFLKGQVSLDVTPDPRLESKVPAVRRAADFLLDASYFKGKYYLYFGATPVVLFMAPYAFLTAGDILPKFVAVLCVCLGFLSAFTAWRMYVRDQAGASGAWSQFFSVVALAFATATPLLLTRGMFYEVAIATGYACVMTAAHLIYRALSGRGSAARNLSYASLFMGLSVGCRPDLILGFPALALAAYLVGRADSNKGRWARICAAAVLPAAAVGACLAIYNYERFGSPMDFGFMYCMNPFFDVSRPMAKAAFFWTNFKWDFLTFPSIGPYFPYIFPESASFRPEYYAGDEAIHGQFPVFCLVLFVGIFAFFNRRKVFDGGSWKFLCVVALMFVGPFTGLSFLCLRADRYVVDFETPLALLTAATAVLVASRLERGPWRVLWSVGLCIAATDVAAFNFFAGLEQFDAFKDTRTESYRTIEALGNVPSEWLIRHGYLHVGPVEVKVVFPQNLKRSRIEPLVSLGTTYKSDSLYVIEHEENIVEFLADHHGYGGHRSKFVPIVPGKEYTVSVDMGALYPPTNHLFFSHFSPQQAQGLKTRFEVKMDGQEVMTDRMNSYDAPPWSLELGRNDITLNPYQTEFSGKIMSMRRLPPTPASEVHLNNGLWRIRCVFPTQIPNVHFPLLSIGLAGTGTLFYLASLPDNRIQFGADEWGYGLLSSEIRSAAPTVEHEIDIFVGPLAQMTQWPKEWGVSDSKLSQSKSVMRVWLDGKVAWTTSARHEFDPQDSFVAVGSNLQGFSTAEPDYFGEIRNDPFAGDSVREFLVRNLAEAPSKASSTH